MDLFKDEIDICVKKCKIEPVPIPPHIAQLPIAHIAAKLKINESVIRDGKIHIVEILREDHFRKMQEKYMMEILDNPDPYIIKLDFAKEKTFRVHIKKPELLNVKFYQKMFSSSCIFDYDAPYLKVMVIDDRPIYNYRLYEIVRHATIICQAQYDKHVVPLCLRIAQCISQNDLICPVTNNDTVICKKMGWEIMHDYIYYIDVKQVDKKVIIEILTKHNIARPPLEHVLSKLSFKGVKIRYYEFPYFIIYDKASVEIYDFMEKLDDVDAQTAQSASDWTLLSHFPFMIRCERNT